MKATYTDATEGNKEKIYSDSKGHSGVGGLAEGMLDYKNDPLVRIVQKNLRVIIIIAAVAAAILYGRYTFQKTSIQGIENTSASFSVFIDELSSYKEIKDELLLAEISAEKKTDLEKREKELIAKINEKLRSLADLKEPYKSLAGKYQGLVNIVAGDRSAGINALKAKSWKNATESGQGMFSEGAALFAARSLLDSDVEGEVQEGKKILKELAAEGEFYDLLAGLALARVAVTQEVKADSLVILEALRLRNPADAAVIDEEIERLK